MKENKFPSILTQLRTSHGETQEQVSDALGISNKTLSKWENGMSSPDISMLYAIAEYFDVSANTLLGIHKDSDVTPEAAIEKEFEPLCKGDTMLRSFELCRELLIRGYSKMNGKDVNVTPGNLYTDGAVRSVIESDSMYQRFINSSDVNMFLVQMKNNENFSWLKNEEKIKRITSLFRFLADPDAAKLVYLIHKDTFPVSFTAEYAAKESGLSVEKTSALLEDAVFNGLAYKAVAHLLTGEMDVYTSNGNACVLSLYSLACDMLCGININCYYYGGTAKMIGGDGK